jgi:pseudouridine synthase
MRLNRFLARAGIASRRHADEAISAGRVSINGNLVTRLGTIVQDGDLVEVDGVAVERPSTRTYLLLNKPLGVVTTMHDPRGRRSVAEFVAGRRGVFPVGRLDYDTGGALVLTDDGDLAHRLLHPRYGVEKAYRVEIAGSVPAGDLSKLRDGILLSDGRASATKIRLLAARRDRSLIDLTIHEGRNRQVRRMFEALGHRVLGLTRVRFGPLHLGDLAPGGTRELTAREIAALRDIAGSRAARLVPPRPEVMQ